MRFEWDERKNRTNIRKHGISFEVATAVFGDPFAATIADSIADGEERWWTIGRVESLLLVVVVHTTMNDEGEPLIRIISARMATSQERRLYEEEQDL